MHKKAENIIFSIVSKLKINAFFFIWQFFRFIMCNVRYFCKLDLLWMIFLTIIWANFFLVLSIWIGHHKNGHQIDFWTYVLSHACLNLPYNVNLLLLTLHNSSSLTSITFWGFVIMNWTLLGLKYLLYMKSKYSDNSHSSAKLEEKKYVACYAWSFYCMYEP